MTGAPLRVASTTEVPLCPAAAPSPPARLHTYRQTTYLFAHRATCTDAEKVEMVKPRRLIMH